MATHWVYKEIYTNKYICNGKAVDFEPLDGNSGVGIFVDGKDDAVLTCLKHAAANHQGGIVFITEAEYTEKKNQRPYNPSAQQSQLERLRIMPHRSFAQKEPGVVEASTVQAVENAKLEAAKANFQATAQAQAVIQAPIPAPAAPPKAFKPSTKRLPKQPTEAAM